MGSLDVGVSSFAGVAVATGPEAQAVPQGLACLAVAYFLVGYCADAVLDYMAWRAEITKLTVMPYLALVRSVHSNVVSWGGQLKHVAWNLEYHRNPAVTSTPKSLQLAEANIANSLETLRAIDSAQKSTTDRMAPLLASWERALRTLAFQVRVRRAMRWIRIWIWDFAVPLGFAGLAVTKTWPRAIELLPRLATL